MRNDRKQLESWFQAERSGDTAAAERALGALLQGLPEARVPAGFAGAVVEAAGVGRARWWERHTWLWRAAFVAWALAGFLSFAWVSSLLVGVVQSGQAVGLGSRLLVVGGRIASEALAAADAIGRASQTFTGALTGPQLLSFLWICAISMVIAARALSSIIAPERSLRHG